MSERSVMDEVDREAWRSATKKIRALEEYRERHGDPTTTIAGAIMKLERVRDLLEADDAR